MNWIGINHHTICKNNITGYTCGGFRPALYEIVVDKPPLDQTVVDELAFAPGFLKNDFTHLQGGARLQCFLTFMWLVRAVSLILPMSSTSQQ